MSLWVSTFPGYSSLMTRVKRIVGGISRTGPVPPHIGLIMDGNRRFAKNNHIELKEGHNMGFESMAAVLELLYESGVSCATVYAFSIENFKRLKTEVDWLMDLAKAKLKQMSQHGELCDQYGIRICILGNFSFLESGVREVLLEIMESTKHNSRAVLNVCFPYTSRDEMTNAIKRTAASLSASTASTASTSIVDIVDEALLDLLMYTSDSPPLDLLIRTSGTYRLSDFLLWQCVPSLCAIVFSDKLWPEFTPWDMTKILLTWSFNKYWYGHGNGQTIQRVMPEKSMDDRSSDNLKSPSEKSFWDDCLPVPSSVSSFKRFASPSIASDDTVSSRH